MIDPYLQSLATGYKGQGGNGNTSWSDEVHRIPDRSWGRGEEGVCGCSLEQSFSWVDAG